MTGSGAGWAPTREAQRIPHTGMAVVTDAANNHEPFPAMVFWFI
jgi:hypothetical protein